MHRFFAPIAISTVNESSYPFFVEQLRASEIDRAILCCAAEVSSKSGMLFEDPDRLAHYIKRFRDDGFEVGVWLDALGHGVVLNHAKAEEILPYTHIMGLNGGHNQYGICPLDPQYRAHYAESLKKIAAMHPTLIMLDDDFRMNTRGHVYDIGCFCERHMKAFFEQIGEEIPRDKLETLLFTGGENPYRSAWLKVQGESLVSFAREMREAIDTVDPSVRFGTCMCLDTWDLDGTDGIELARAFAGNTKPFLRTFGAPYHNRRIGAAVESTRMQAAWCRDAGIEISAEGDVYPRPRYNVPSRLLELFDLALLASHAVDADQKYMFDYNRSAWYETGYAERHVKNRQLRQEIDALFAGKTPVGVRVFEAMRKIETWDLPQEKPTGLCNYLHGTFGSRVSPLLAELSIPTTYDENGDGPVAVFGESARHIPLSALQNGALLDAKAALLLQERGVDVGLVSTVASTAKEEHFPDAADTMAIPGGLALQALACAPEAKALSLLLPDRTPGAYLYENAQGQRFYVLAEDSYHRGGGTSPDYHLHYHRQKQLIAAAEWVARRPLSAVCPQNPYLYILASKNEDALSVLLINVFEDEIPTPTITLDGEYAHIRCVNCTGTIKGNTVTLSELPPLGVAAFEVTP